MSSFKRTSATTIGDILNEPNPEGLMMQSTSQTLSKHTIPNGISDDENIYQNEDNGNKYYYDDHDNEESRSYDMSNNIEVATDYINVNSKYYDANTTNNNYYEAFVGGPITNSPHSSTESETSSNEECMRKILQCIFVICIVFIISPLIFFIAGASSIIPEYARISPTVREEGDTDDSNTKKIFHYPTISQICDDNSHFCLRYVFFLIYLITFVIMFICCCSLLAIRKSKHPLKSRSSTFIFIFCIALPLYQIWACVGLLYSPDWMGCHATHIFNNLCYPLLIFPYFFRAFRIKKIYDDVTISNVFNKDLNIFRSARTPSMLSTNLTYANVEVTSSANANIQSVLSSSNLAAKDNRLPPKNGTSLRNQRSNSVISAANDSSFNFEDALAFSQALDRRLLKWFLLCLSPFIFLCILDFLTEANHILPTFIVSCDPQTKSLSVIIWVIIHSLEIFVLILMVYWIRLVWRAFSVKQELMIVSIIDMVFCACMIGFNPSSDKIDDGVLLLYLILMRGMAFFMITLLFPLYKSYFLVSYLPDIPTQDVITSLQAILDDMDACGFFRAFMQSHDQHYLLDFWMECELFKDACYNHEIEDIYLSASKIFQKYFYFENDSKASSSIRYLINSKEATKSLTIGGVVGSKRKKNKKKTFCKAINKIFDEKNKGKVEIHPNIFDHPHRVVFEHMEAVYYRLFLRSKDCKELLASIAGQEEVLKKLINQEML